MKEHDGIVHRHSFRGKGLKLLFLALGGLSLLFCGRAAHAASTASVVLKVSISNTKSFSVDISTWNFGAMAANATSVSSSPITVTNDSGGVTETFQLQFSTPTVAPSGWLPSASWNTTTPENYVLGGQFSDTQPPNADGSWGSDIITTSLQSCTQSVFGNGTLAESGSSVPANSSNTRKLWFRIETPASTTDATQHNIYVTLSMQ